MRNNRRNWSEELLNLSKWIGQIFLECFYCHNCNETFVFIVDDEDDEDKNGSCTKPLSSKVDDLQTCNDLVAKHGTALQKAISELQDLSGVRDDGSELAKRLKVANEKATLFRITSSAMISVSYQAITTMCI